MVAHSNIANAQFMPFAFGQSAEFAHSAMSRRATEIYRILHQQLLMHGSPAVKSLPARGPTSIPERARFPWEGEAPAEPERAQGRTFQVSRESVRAAWLGRSLALPSSYESPFYFRLQEQSPANIFR